MPRKFTLFFLVLLLSLSSSRSQNTGEPSAEVRAVWIATASGLDWPKSTDPAEQQSALREIVATLRREHFNTIYFQVRSRGDAFYRSSYEPWAESLTGTLGRDPGYDPLSLLLREAHQAGMEVHAWFNLYKVNGPETPEESTPPHIVRAHPEWVFRYENEFWLNPGIPAVNRYLADVALELVRRYEIDGIQFDFIRYPGPDVPDSKEYRLYGKGVSLHDWRRENINRFVESFYGAASAVRPSLKIGATPVGNFDGAGDLPSGYSMFFQDSPGWLRNGTMDYLVPQIYWDFGNSPADPDFGMLARQWSRQGNGRHIYAGIGIYKPKILAQLPRQIDSARAAGCSGEALFRYGNLGDFSALRGRYHEPAGIPAMPWKQKKRPPPPLHITVSEVADGIYRIAWRRPETGAQNPFSYRVYRSTTATAEGEQKTFAIPPTSNDTLSFTDSAGTVAGTRYYYSVTTIDEADNESGHSQVVSPWPEENEHAGAPASSPVTLSAALGENDSSKIIIRYSLPGRMLVTLMIQQNARTTRNPVVTNLVGDVRDAGSYVVELNRADFLPGEYFVVLNAGGATIDRLLVLPSRP